MKLRFLPLFLIGVLGILIFFTWERNYITTYSGNIMGTTYKVILVDYDQDLIEEGIYSSLNSLIKRCLLTLIPLLFLD
ncbi:MAG: hypothetical protein CM1200mP12_16470 [Gammaproteobacteria bacterium]|nr:MAG: hypothetical protein CM1200mP12_16470 [Gammaproteobacteria bacterium]